MDFVHFDLKNKNKTHFTTTVFILNLNLKEQAKYLLMTIKENF